MEGKAGLFYVAHMLVRESYFTPLLSTAGGSTLQEVVTLGAMFHNVIFTAMLRWLPSSTYLESLH